MKKHNRQQGFSVVEVVIVVVVLAVLGYIGWLVYSNMIKTGAPNTEQSSAEQKTTTAAVTWAQSADGYQPSGMPPACPDKMVQQFPADITQVTAVLYPGQVRGGNYKPHGGLQFGNTKDNNVTVKAPFDGQLIDGAAYIEAGETQYLFDVMNDCGMMYRVDHLATLSDALATVAKRLPAPGDSSATTRLEPASSVPAGTVLATVVGFKVTHNVSFDFGVYDWNQPNAASKDSTWAANPQHSFPVTKHALCWFDELSDSDAAAIRALPAGDMVSGKTSDYCK